jgi:hypothetical protein
MQVASDMIAALNEIESRFPVQEWRARDIDLWPSYRIRLFGAAIDSALLSEQKSITRWEKARRLIWRVNRTLMRVPLARLRDMSGNAHVQAGTQAILFSDGMSFTRLGDTWFDRIMDPLAEAYGAKNEAVLKLTLLSEAHVPRWMPSVFVQPALDRVKFLAPYLEKPALELPAFEEVVTFARTRFGADVPSRDWLARQSARLDGLANWFGRIMARTGARHGFVNTWYSLEGMAFVLAARRAGIVSIDMQHGMQGPHHVAYASWLGAPGAGYTTMPREFWVWTDEAAETINRWSGQTSTHRAHVSGNPWFDTWRNDGNDLVLRYLAAARSLRNPAGRCHVLVTLSWGINQEETDKIIRAAKQSGPDIIWWWRLHPVEAHRRAEFAAMLAREGLDGSQVGIVTDLPLYAVIRAADVTVAHSSTSIQEAADFGVPSVVTSDYGADLHAGLICAGIVVQATSDVAIAQAVNDLARKVGTFQQATLESSRMELHMDRLKAAAVSSEKGRHR